jgi:uncharacterized membrane protein YqjE
MSEGYETGGTADPRTTRYDPDTALNTRFRPAAGAGAGNQEGIGELVSGLLQDLQDLIRGEVRLAKTEIQEDAKTAARGAGMIAAGAAVGFVGFWMLMLAVAYVLAETMDMWLATGIVAVALLVIAAIVAMVGRNRLTSRNLAPDETIDTLMEDQAWAKQQINSVKK